MPIRAARFTSRRALSVVQLPYGISRNQGKLAAAALEDLFHTLEPASTLLGLDLGTKTIGVSAGSWGSRFAVPKFVISRTKFTADAAKLLEIAAANDAAVFVIGLPLNMDGSEGPRAQATRAFVRNMERLTALPFVFWDERLSTVAAERALISMDVSRAKRAARIDAAAAAFILQGALDRLYAISAGAEES
jgi:putative holliday junction resolvase